MASQVVSSARIEDRTTDLDKLIMDLFEMTPEEAETVKKYSKNSAYPLAALKEMTVRLGLPKSKGKDELIDMIRTKMADRARVASLSRSQGSTTSAISASAESSTTFRPWLHTYPRLINIALMHPQSIQNTTNLASREQLQFHEIGVRQPIWTVIAEEFNNPEFDVGELAGYHDFFIVDGVEIDPRNVERLGISPEQAMNILHKILAAYKEAYANHTQSGHHHEDDFPNFCRGFYAVPAFYLKVALEENNNEDLLQWCRQGSVIEDGFDSGAPASSVSTSSSASSRNPITPVNLSNHQTPSTRSGSLQRTVNELAASYKRKAEAEAIASVPKRQYYNAGAKNLVYERLQKIWNDIDVERQRIQNDTARGDSHLRRLEQMAESTQKEYDSL